MEISAELTPLSKQQTTPEPENSDFAAPRCFQLEQGFSCGFSCYLKILDVPRKLGESRYKGVSFFTDMFTPPKIIITEALGPPFPEKSHLTLFTFFYGCEQSTDPHRPPLCKINKHLPAVQRASSWSGSLGNAYFGTWLCSDTNFWNTTANNQQSWQPEISTPPTPGHCRRVACLVTCQAGRENILFVFPSRFEK